MSGYNVHLSGYLLTDYIQVVKGKVEEIDLPEKADILISEPMGKFFNFISYQLFV